MSVFLLLRKQAALLLPAAIALLIAVGVLGCGPKVSGDAVGLPGDGTENLAKARQTSTTDEAAMADLWRDKELIEAPAAQQPSAVPLPSIERFTLKNGLQVIAVQDPLLPLVSMQVAVKTGKRQDPREQVGLAEFAAQAMPRGTRARSAARIASEIEAVGGTLQANASYEATLVSCKTLAKDMSTCLKLVPDVLASPNFPESEVDIVRRGLLASVRQRLDDAGLLASAHFQSALWGDEHIRGSVLSESTIDAISRKSLVDWHNAWVRPNNAVLAISGDFNPDKLKAELERSFGKWKPSALPSPVQLKLPTIEGLKVRLVDKPGQTQSHIRIGHLGLAHRSPDFFPAMVFNHALGGGQFSSRLMKVVRSAEGKAYTASSTFDRNLETGAFVAATFTRSAETLPTVRLVQKVISSMASEGPTEAEVAAAITNIAGSYATRFETAGDVANALLAAELHGLGDEYVSNYPLEVAAVTREQAAAAAARILDPVDAVLVIVGDASVVEPQLKSVGLTYEVIPHTAPVSNWERAAKAEALEKVDDPEQQAAARKLLGEALQAKGGAKRLGALKSFRWLGDAELNLPTGVMSAEIEKQFSAPDKLRLDMRVGGGQVKIVTVLNGTGGWALQENPNGKNLHEFSPEELRALASQLWRDSELVLLRQLEKGIVIRPLGERTKAGTMAQAIHMARGDGSMAVTLLIDPKTKHLLGMDYSEQGMNISERFSEYKKVQGLQVAHRRTTKGPEVDLKVQLKSFAVDEAIADSEYLLPKQAGK